MLRKILALVLVAGCMSASEDWVHVGDISRAMSGGAAIVDGDRIILVPSNGEVLIFDPASGQSQDAGFNASADGAGGFAWVGERLHWAQIAREGEWYQTPCGPGCHGDGYRERLVLRVHGLHPGGGMYVIGSDSPVIDGGIFYDSGEWYVVGGTDVNGTPSNGIWRLGGEASLVAEMDEPALEPLLAQTEGGVYVLLHNGGGGRPILVLNASSGHVQRWSSLPPLDYGQATAAANGSGVCVFGAMDGSRTVSVCVDQNGVRTAPMPTVMNAPAAWVHGSYWVFSGGEGQPLRAWRFTP